MKSIFLFAAFQLKIFKKLYVCLCIHSTMVLRKNTSVKQAFFFKWFLWFFSVLAKTFPKQEGTLFLSVLGGVVLTKKNSRDNRPLFVTFQLVRIMNG